MFPVDFHRVSDAVRSLFFGQPCQFGVCLLNLVPQREIEKVSALVGKASAQLRKSETVN
jgi:hypothetical protein